MSVDYGFIEAETVPAATCNARVILPSGDDAPGLRNPQVARPNNKLRWDYPTPPTDAGNAIAIVTCIYKGLSGNTWVSFDVGS